MVPATPRHPGETVTSPDRLESGDMPERLSVAQMIAALTWEQIAEDGIITMEEVDAMLRAKGCDPSEYDHLYE